MKKNILSGVFSSVLSLFLAICLIAGGLCFVAKETVCRPDTLLQAAKESGYYTELYEQIRYKWENLISITGIDNIDPYVALLTPEQVEQHAKLYLESSYSGGAMPDSSALRQALEDMVRQYAYTHNIYATPDSVLEQNIRDLVDACMAEYTRAIQIPLLPKLLGTAAAAYAYLNMAIPVLGVAALMLTVFLFFLQRKRLDTLYYASISAATGAVLLLGLTGLAAYLNVANRLPFETSAMKTLVVNFVVRLLGSLQDLGLAFLVLAAVLILPYVIVFAVRLLMKKHKRYIACQTIQPGEGHKAGRELLATLYKEATGRNMPEIAIAEGGKPYFVGSRWHFSISHTDRHVFCVLSPRPVGIDAEEKDRQVKPGLAQRVLSESEYAQYEQAEDKDLALLKFWVLKEAAGKLTGEGVRGFPNKTQFQLNDPALMEMEGCVVAIKE